MRIGLDHPDIHFEVVYGISDNARAWYDNANAYRLGYRPEDQAEDFAASVTEAPTSTRRGLVRVAARRRRGVSPDARSASRR